jgi:hypothetical protein
MIGTVGRKFPLFLSENFLCSEAVQIDEEIGNYIVLINTERTRLRHRKEEVKTKQPEQLASSYHLLEMKVQE